LKFPAVSPISGYFHLEPHLFIYYLILFYFWPMPALQICFLLKTAQLANNFTNFSASGNIFYFVFIYEAVKTAVNRLRLVLFVRESVMLSTNADFQILL